MSWVYGKNKICKTTAKLLLHTKFFSLGFFVFTLNNVIEFLSTFFLSSKEIKFLLEFADLENNDQLLLLIFFELFLYWFCFLVRQTYAHINTNIYVHWFWSLFEFCLKFVLEKPSCKVYLFFIYIFKSE